MNDIIKTIPWRRTGARGMAARAGDGAARREGEKFILFEKLYNSAKNGELICVEGGITRFHICKNGQLTIYEILVLPEFNGRGIANEMLDRLKRMPGATSLFAKCPADLMANEWYERRGFVCEGEETTRTGRRLKLWRFSLAGE